MSETQVRRRLATVGTGYFSQFHHDAWRRLDVNLVGVCSLNKVQAAATAAAFAGCQAFDDFETMLDAVKPDLVDIIVPPDMHMAFIEMCVARYIPIICQKPFTRSLAEAEACLCSCTKTSAFSRGT
jgi:predicted dehydrogenase